MTELLTTGPAQAASRLLLGHGAGAGMTSPWQNRFAGLLAERGIAVVRFEFAYMHRRRCDGVRRPPPRAESLTAEYQAAIDRMPPGGRLFIGGKSMGGRVASLIAEDRYRQGAIAGLVCLGYPFHSIKLPERLRTAHLEPLTCPTLIVQGTRDPFGSRQEVESYPIPPSITLHWIADGDHDLRVRRVAGTPRRDPLCEAADAVQHFMQAAHSAG